VIWLFAANHRGRTYRSVNSFKPHVPTNKVHKLKVMFTNVDVFTNKHAEFISYITIEQPLIIALCEVFPKNRASSEVEDFILNLEKYDRLVPATNGGRGVVIYAHSSLQAISVDQFDHNNFDESVWCRIKLGLGDSLLFGCVYRSPSSMPDNNAALCKLMTEVCEANYSHKLIVGDFNFKEISWADEKVNASDEHPASMFFECIQDNFLHQHVTRETRFRGNQMPSLLDLVLTNEVDMVDSDNLVYDPPLGKSDHSTLLFDYNCYLEVPANNTPRFQYYKGAYADMNCELGCIDWCDRLSSDSVEDNWATFTTILSQVMDKHIPKCRSGRNDRERPLWMNKEVADVIRKKRRVWSKYWKSRSRKDYNSYKLLRNRCTETVRAAKKDYERMIATESKKNSKSFWRYVKSKTKTKTGVSDLLKADGDMTAGEQEKVDTLNNFFCSVFTQDNEEDGDCECKLPDDADAPSISTLSIQECVVRKKLDNINTDKSPGPDGIHPKVLFECREHLCKPLSIIFQQTLDTGLVPQEWKIAHVSPIFKKGDKKKPGNYRPVSLTSIVCKLCESVVRDHIMEHMSVHNLFSQQQYGFRPKRSCNTQLLEVFDKWSEFMDAGYPFDNVYLDFSKAFDTVPHKKLGVKLKAYGIDASLWEWIMDFLGSKSESSRRKQRVAYNSAYSEWREVLSGVPQGSVLGPVLFLIFINDLPNVVKGIVKIFADDTKLFDTVQDEDRCRQLQNDLDLLCDWSDTWKLRFNADKCKVLHFGKDNIHFNYTMRDGDRRTFIKQDTEECDLGVTFETNLKFEKQTRKCASKGNRMVGLIRHSFDHMDKDMFITLYKSLVRPLMEYATPVWSPHLKKDIRLLEQVQRRATKLVQEIRNLSYEERLRHLGLPTLEYRRDRSDMIQVYRILTGIDDMDANTFFHIANSTTRGHSRKLYKRRCRTNMRKNSFAYRVVDKWNSLPEPVVLAETMNIFKSRLNEASWNEFKFRTSC
jgi:hypothetical protein